MSKKNDPVYDQVEKMIFQCDSFRKIIPSDNTQAKLIVANFYEQLNTLKNIIESNSSDELIDKMIPLTKRELEILEHVSNGYTNKEIASALSVSPKTIEFHMRSILQKTESCSRTEAVKNAIKSGWI